MARLHALAIILLLPVLTGQTPAPPPLKPDEIYAKALARIRAFPVAPYAVWRSKWTVYERASGPVVGPLYHAQLMAARTADRLEAVMLDPPAGGAADDPFVGGTFEWPFTWGSEGFVAPRPRTTAPPPSSDASAPPTLVSVVARERPAYAFELAGMEDIGGSKTYHLRLRPLFDPQINVLRDMWIDASSFDLRKAHFAGSYSPRPGAPESASDVTEFFGPVASYWLAFRTVWTYQNARVGSLIDACIATISFSDELPDWVFDRDQLAAHSNRRTFLSGILDEGSYSIPTCR